MRIVIEKQTRRLQLADENGVVFSCRIGLGSQPLGAKRMQGDGKTPEGRYFLCLIKEQGKYGRSLGISYPNAQDAQLAFLEGRIDDPTLHNIQAACAQLRRPPWGSPLGGEIYIHEGGSASDWTAGCIALEKEDMDRVFPYRDQISEVVILP